MDYCSDGITGQNRANLIENKELIGGDTGGPPQIKFNELVIEMPPDIINSPTIMRHIMDEDESQMPDIIKEIRKTTNCYKDF